MIAYVVFSSFPNLVVIMRQLEDLLRSWEERGVVFNFNGYGGHAPHLSIRFEDSGRESEDLEARLEGFENLRWEIQEYGERPEVLTAYRIGSLLALKMFACLREFGIKPVDYWQIVHGFVNASGNFSFQEEERVYKKILERIERRT